MADIPPQHLSSAELEKLLTYIETAKAIVVGGQALALWCRFYLDRNPKIATYYSLTSEDLDVYGSAEDAKTLAQHLLDAEVLIPDGWDNTANAAVVLGRIGDRQIRIDFLRSVLGVDHKSLTDHYVTLTKDSPAGALHIHLMHPLDCLRSRLSNLNDLHRHGVHAVSSAKAAMMVVELFIDELLKAGDFRNAQASLISLAFIGRDRCLSKSADLKFSINPIEILQKFRVDARLDHRWRSNQLASLLEKLRTKKTVSLVSKRS